MDLNKTPHTLITAACGIALGAFLLWFGQLALQRMREHDAKPRRAGLKHQLMRHKASAMDEALHATIDGNLVRVNTATTKLKQFANRIDGFLATEIYSQYGDDFHRAIEDLLAASEANDREGSKEAILRLERSCIECHFLINEPR